MRLIGLVLAVTLVIAPLAEAQQGAKVPRIGILRSGSPPDPLVEAFRQGLRDLGYVEGRNIDLEYRWSEGKEERLPALAAELVHGKVDVIVAAGGGGLLAAKRATAVIPIVMPVGPDPVKAGFAASFARPGGNLTGLAAQVEDLPGKWMQLLQETFPAISRVAFLWDSTIERDWLQGSETAARSLNLRLTVLTVRRADQLEAVFEEAKTSHAEAVIVAGSSLIYSQRRRIVELATKHRLPTIHNHKDYVLGAGSLMSYGPDISDLFRRAATYVDKILKGAKPGDLPIEQPTKFELVISLKTARALGLTIPQSILRRADQVIE